MPCARRLARKPQPSVFAPVILPSPNVSVLTAPSGLVDRVAHLEGGQFVRDGDVGTSETGVHQPAHGVAEMFRRDRQWNVGAVNAVFFQPVAMQPRRPRVADRPTDNTGDPGVT
jgi:hypothetical protein